MPMSEFYLPSLVLEHMSYKKYTQNEITTGSLGRRVAFNFYIGI